MADKFKPYAAQDPASVLGGRFGRVYVLAPSFCGVRAVERLCHVESQLGVRERYIPDSQLAHFRRLDPQEFPLQSLLKELKEEMLLHGATPEAVMLVGDASPFTKKELNTMAQKLKTKTAGAAKKPAAKAPAAPKAEGDAPKKRGPRSSLDPKAKITLTDKGKERLAKGGDTGAVKNLQALKDAKTVGKAQEAGLTAGDINYAARSGTITVG